MSTCSDIRHPPQNVLDGKDETFFATTGLYPQEIVVDLGKVSKRHHQYPRHLCVRVCVCVCACLCLYV